MDKSSFCGLKQFVSTVFWRKSSRRHTRSRQNRGSSDKDSSIHSQKGQIGSHEKPDVTASQSDDSKFKPRVVRRSGMRPNFRYLVHENSLAPFLDRGELIYPTREMNKREIRDQLGTNGRIGAFRPRFDPYLNTAATLPIAEESYDSGLLRLNIPGLS